MIELSVRAILLDLDKTLVNLEDHVDYCAALADARRVAGVGEVEVDVPPSTWGRCAHRTMELLVALSGRRELWTACSDAIERWELAGAPRSEQMPGLTEFLNAVRELPTAIVTLVGPRACRSVLERHGIVVDVEVARAPDLRPKPSGDQVERALQALGAPAEEAVMVGDGAWDEAAARAAGVRFLGLRNGRADPGFDGSPVVEDLAEAARALRPETS
jgi:phosphoglycolate phosphatase-like HAD superfamily hydrolase